MPFAATGTRTHMIRAATLEDLDALIALEEDCFDTDRLSRRQFRYMLTRAKAATLVYEEDGTILGYAMVSFSRGTSSARLYSIAVDPAARGRRIGRELVGAAEDAARERDYAYLRLEVRRDNPASVRLFRGLGYKQFGEYDEYYEDRMDALRFEKSLASGRRPVLMRVPYYEQTLDFTCGPAALMMAMKALDPRLLLDRKLELRLWREATTIYMTSGHGGCSPYGIALSAAHRGFPVEVVINEQRMPLLDSVRSPEKREVMRLVQEDMTEELRALDVPVSHRSVTPDDLKARFDEGAVPVVLISSYRIYGQKAPHWVVVTGFDEHFVYVHDPFVDYDEGETAVDSINMPILRRDFERMAHYGKAGLQAVVIVHPQHQSG